MFCTNCGMEIDPGDNFCVKCGQETINSVSANDWKNVKSPSFEQDMQTFVDDNYPFYATKWRRMNETGKSNTLNLASFFFGIAWLGYRKLYRPVFMIALLFLIIDLILYLSGYRYSLDGFYDPAGYSTEIVFMIVMGMYGNYYYRKNVVKQVVQIRESGLQPEMKQTKLKRKGGTSITGILLAAGIMAVVYVLPTTFLLPINVDPVDEVKYGEFENYPTYTIDDIFSDFFDNGTWEKVTGDKKITVVAYDGEKQLNNEHHKVQVQFLKERDNKELSIEKIMVDGEELTLLEEEDFLNFMFNRLGFPEKGNTDDYI